MPAAGSWTTGCAGLPEGAAGELLIGGAGVALGYLNRPELTAERFVDLPVQDPLARSGKTARFYRTGDLVRRLPGGNLVFAGRADDQVKIRGYRVEPGEVEAAVAALPGVAMAAVVARTDSPTAPRLVAYVVPASAGVEAAALADALAARLPDYMLPSSWLMLPELPLTANGKVDRRRLPEPDAGELAPTSSELVTTEEQLLAGMFSALLGVEGVGATDSFFDLGGHSLLATRLASRIHEVFAVEAPLAALFANPTVRGMARLVASLRGSANSAVAAPPITALAPRGRRPPGRAAAAFVRAAAAVVPRPTGPGRRRSRAALLQHPGRNPAGRRSRSRRARLCDQRDREAARGAADVVCHPAG